MGGAINPAPSYAKFSYWPVICPAGFFCEAGVDVPETDGTYYKNFP
jgi:hypothetical protein